MVVLDEQTGNRKFPEIDVDGYLKRIGCEREFVPSLKYLKVLHRNHLLHIPFENLDIHIGNEIILDIQKIYQKVIKRRRGGFCYELNGLFCHLLYNLGFDVKMISARVVDSDGSNPPEFDHLAVIVNIDGADWIADVGFGKSFLTPKELVTEKIQMDYNSFYKIIWSPIDNSYKLLSSNDSEDFKEEYLFTDKERQFVEFIGMCHYHQTAPDSHFRKQKMITLAKPNGRVTLTDNKLIITKLGKREELPILNIDEFRVKLWEHFGVRVYKNT